MIRIYLSDIIDTGTPPQSIFEPVLASLVSPGTLWAACDMRPTGSTVGRIFVWSDISDSDHATLAADPRITVVPFVDTNGNALDVTTAVIGDVASAARSAIATRLDAAGIPTADFTLATPLKKVIARCIRRGLTSHILGGNDFNGSLDALVNTIAPAKRNAIASILTAHGYDVSVILGTDTIRQALQKLCAQNVPVLANPWD